MGLLEQLLFETEWHLSCQPYLEQLYKTLFGIAYYGMMRIGEISHSPSLHYVRAKDVHIAKNKDKILMILHTSKTHGRNKRPQKIKISRNENLKGRDKFFCPFKLMQQYMVMRGTGFSNEDEPLFILSDRSHVTPDMVRSMLRVLLNNLGLDTYLYNTTSFHSGRCVDMYKMGYSLEVVKRAGWWRSNAIYQYLKL